LARAVFVADLCMRMDGEQNEKKECNSVLQSMIDELDEEE